MSESFVRSFREARRESLRAFNEGDFESAFADLAPDVEWHLLPWLLETGVLKGRDAVVRYFAGVREGIDWHVESREFIDAGNRRVVVHQHGRGAGRTTQIATREATVDFFQIWEVGEDGLVVSVREFDDRAEALKAAGLSE